MSDPSSAEAMVLEGLHLGLGARIASSQYYTLALIIFKSLQINYSLQDTTVPIGHRRLRLRTSSAYTQSQNMSGSHNQCAHPLARRTTYRHSAHTFSDSDYYKTIN